MLKKLLKIKINTVEYTPWPISAMATCGSAVPIILMPVASWKVMNIISLGTMRTGRGTIKASKIIMNQKRLNLNSYRERA